MKKLNGRKILILGNHDKPNIKGFDGIYEMAKVKDKGHAIILCHYPQAEWDGYYNGVFHVYGHIHNNQNKAAEIMATIPNAFNVGVDVIGFTPRTADEIITPERIKF